MKKVGGATNEKESGGRLEDRELAKVSAKTNRYLQGSTALEGLRQLRILQYQGKEERTGTAQPGENEGRAKDNAGVAADERWGTWRKKKLAGC